MKRWTCEGSKLRFFDVFHYRIHENHFFTENQTYEYCKLRWPFNVNYFFKQISGHPNEIKYFPSPRSHILPSSPFLNSNGNSNQHCKFVKNF